MTRDPALATTIRDRVALVRQRIEQACARSGRDPREVQLVAVSKTHPIEAVREAIEADVTALGENRAQELVPKAQAAEEAGLNPTWHFIGHLQRNKVHDVAPYMDVLHSIDHARLIEEIERRRPRDAAGGALPCYLEVNISGEEQKHGVSPTGLPALLVAAAASPAVRVEGLMTVAPLVRDPEAVRPVFRALRELAAAHGLRGLSMGMTDDFEVATEEGATVVRVGRAIFGERRSG